MKNYRLYSFKSVSYKDLPLFLRGTACLLMNIYAFGLTTSAKTTSAKAIRPNTAISLISYAWKQICYISLWTPAITGQLLKESFFLITAKIRLRLFVLQNCKNYKKPTIYGAQAYFGSDEGKNDLSESTFRSNALRVLPTMSHGPYSIINKPKDRVHNNIPV